MIVKTFTNQINEPLQVGITCLLVTQTANTQPLDFEKDFCYCQFTACENEYIKAFYGIGDYENDYFSLFSQIEIEHTVSFIIKKISTNVETVLQNGTHGVLKTFDPNTQQFIVDWGKVAQTLGNGLYDLIIVWDIMGQVQRKEYKTFFVMPFSTEDADGTVRVTTYKNGDIENGYYFNSYNVFSQIRVLGEIREEQIITEIDSNENLLREKIQVQDREYSEYELFLPSLNETTLKEFIDNQLVSDNIIINDYNIFNKNYKDLKVRKIGIKLENVSKFYTNLILNCEDFKTKVKNNE